MNTKPHPLALSCGINSMPELAATLAQLSPSTRPGIAAAAAAKIAQVVRSNRRRAERACNEGISDEAYEAHAKRRAARLDAALGLLANGHGIEIDSCPSAALWGLEIRHGGYTAPLYTF